MPPRKPTTPRRPGKGADFPCPACGAIVPAGSHACPECGSDEETGWSDGADVWSADIPTGHARDDDFDYDEFVRDEFPDQAGRTTLTFPKILIGVMIFAALIFLLMMALANR